MTFFKGRLLITDQAVSLSADEADTLQYFFLILEVETIKLDSWLLSSLLTIALSVGEIIYLIDRAPFVKEEPSFS